MSKRSLSSSCSSFSSNDIGSGRPLSHSRTDGAPAPPSRRTTKRNGPKKRHQKAQRKVQFHQSVIVRIVQRVYDLGATDPLWYTVNDFKDFEVDARNEWEEEKKKALESSSSTTKKKLQVPSYLRGIELDEPDDEERSKLLTEAASVVLLCQECQRNEGIQDPDLMASVYRKHCRKSQEVALLTGMKDEKWVKQEQKRQQALELEDSRRKERTCPTRPNYRQQRERFLRAKLGHVRSYRTQHQ